MLQEKINQGDLVVYMDPGHPLPTIANRPAQAQFERQAQARQKAALTGQHQPGTYQHHAYAQGLGVLCGFFPGNAQLTGKVLLDRLRGLGQLTFTTVAIPPYRRPGDQHLRALLTALEPGKQLLGKGDPAAPQQRTPARAPWPIGYRCAGQIDHRIDRIIRT
ncbi:hypothetical protein D9M71_326130 [compost metagenome]